ncbi:VP0952 family biofilm-associated protein [Vibrio fluvialis]|uniref:hypothetical protein n=1 Tax=Vibrio fluvialis TaxID=676 RepID=UPI001F198DF1|nr:hypothetical protein [Vibrio fluvialis]MCE7659998.1 hypothetical protein [Vibrio fluvialis]
MVFSAFQFVITTLLVMVCARALGLSEGDVPFITFVIPALWILPRGGITGFVLLAGMDAYGITLPYQPASLSVSMWVLFPMMMVAFSRGSNKGIMAISALIVITLQVGIMVTQAAGKLDGEPWMTVVQLAAVVVIWWAASSWKPSHSHSWWALGLIIPLWVAGLTFAAVIALCLTGLVAVMESLSQVKSFSWSKLLCWTLPSVSFMAVVLSPDIDVPKPVFVVWICLLTTAWMTDYILKNTEERPL